MKVNFPTDLDGFLSQECPSCKQAFKVVFGEGSEEPVSFCPYCGYEGQDCWWTQEQADYAKAVAYNLTVKPELEKLSKRLNKKSKGWLKVSLSADLLGGEKSPVDVERDFNIYHFPCHRETIKAHRYEKLFCIVCGKEKDINMSESKKVFLSHKSVDKDLVIEIGETLKTLGYDPWFADEELAAGVSLDRGLLKGMQESCGVVFFITPSFKDESFLESEINHAIVLKRERGEKFAIITLLLSDEQGKVGEIPDILKGYVWKTPETDLQALRDIVKALPIFPASIDWKEGIEGVVAIPPVKSRTEDLSEEAKQILLSAAEDDRGQIFVMSSFDGNSIQTGQKSFPPRQASRREQSLWDGGLEDLLRRGLIKQDDSKGQRFSITREGYTLFDSLTNKSLIDG